MQSFQNDSKDLFKITIKKGQGNKTIIVEDNNGTKIDEIEKEYADINIKKESHFSVARIKILLPPILKINENLMDI